MVVFVWELLHVSDEFLTESDGTSLGKWRTIPYASIKNSSEAVRMVFVCKLLHVWPHTHMCGLSSLVIFLFHVLRGFTQYMFDKVMLELIVHVAR